MKKVLTIREISEELDVDYTTIKTYLESYRFTKFRTLGESKRKTLIVAYLNMGYFWFELLDYLFTKKNKKYFNIVKRYIDKNNIKL